jgi:phosphatidylserine/phosphatidylglycerophosphate/cardiolipin synthase-like enzyme
MLRILLMDWLRTKKNRQRAAWFIPLLLLAVPFIGIDRAKAIIAFLATGTPPAIGTNAQTPSQPLFPVTTSKPVEATPVSRTTETPSTQVARLPADGPVRVYFTRPGSPPTEPGNIAHICAFYIDQAQKSLDVAAFELDNKIITEAFVRAVRRGVQVRLVTETDYLDEQGIVTLKSLGVPIVDDKRAGALMHNKFIVIDNRAVWTGSMNFTENCAYRNDNHGIVIDDVKIAANYATKFQWMFEQKKFGGAPSATARIPYPVVTLRDGTTVENYFSTHDRVADRVRERLEQASVSIHFLAFSFTHDAILQAMLGRAQRGVPVRGVFEKSQATSSFSAFEKMRNVPNVQVFVDANPRNMHHKVIVIDGRSTVAGSFNFSANADRNNDENLVIIHNPAVAQVFEQEFQRVFGLARAAEGR